MRIALYGLPCAGKTTLMNKIKNIETICGSELLNKILPDFNNKTSEEQNKARIQLLDKLKEKTNFIIDGHYQFGDNIVFTKDDGKLYDVFLYLYENPEIIKERIQQSNKNQKYINCDFKSWQDNEIKNLRKSCHENNKDFYVINNIDFFDEFLQEILNGYSNVNYAKTVVKEILETTRDIKAINLLDGDKTITTKDTSRLIFDYKTNIFDGNFYTGYQFFVQDKELKNFIKKDVKIEYNKYILEQIDNKNSFIISSGCEDIYKEISKEINIKSFAGKNISADTKYFITKFLKDHKHITAYGDSANDYYMLKEANLSYLVIQDKISKSFEGMDLEGLNKLYIPNIYSNKYPSRELEDLINITKSNSGISGNCLAKTHKELGYMLGTEILKAYDPTQTTIVAILRGGLFISTGIYFSFNGKFAIFDPKKDDFNALKINTKNIILVDSVVNNGNTIEKIINNIDSDKNIILATNVIREDTLQKFNNIPLYAIRTSKNNFIGDMVKMQNNGKGPDTTERLFNNI